LDVADVVQGVNMGSVIKMYLSSTGSESANIDVPMGGFLIGLSWAVSHDSDADADSCQLQLSFRSAITNVNDDRGIIDEVRTQNQLVTSGVGVNSINKYTPLPDIPIAAGERLFLLSSVTTGITLVVSCMLHFTFDIDKVASRRR